MYAKTFTQKFKRATHFFFFFSLSALDLRSNRVYCVSRILNLFFLCLLNFSYFYYLTQFVAMISFVYHLIRKFVKRIFLVFIWAFGNHFTQPILRKSINKSEKKTKMQSWSHKFHSMSNLLNDYSYLPISCCC